MDDLRGNPALTRTARTALKRHKERGSHERALICAIIDEALICHVGFADGGAVTRVLPTAHARVGDALYLHGARSNFMLRALCDGREAALTFTLLDGLVFAARAFNHSMNFRSAMLIARGSEVTDLEEKARALSALVEHMAAGRTREALPPSEDELRATRVVRLPIEEGSAKVRSGPPAATLDADAAAAAACWVGEVPLALRASAARRAPSAPASAVHSDAAAGVLCARGDVRVQPVQWRGHGACVSTDPSLLDVRFVHDFLARESYWAQGIAEAVLRRAIDHSVCFGMYREADGAQVGFARVTTDFARTAHLADVFIAEACRGQKLGTFLLECVLAHPELRGVARWLLGTRDAHAFYARFGFVRDEQGRTMGRVL
jgi:nitroimidazol reductase NimA-like FMN-containing flavoprotein (pyridoxamine 5'-phosphate oxidase superfamily)/N-acetylglutamate synthase-like GNAT family acetyltransferase